MAKRVDPLKAKQAKQKKLAIGLSILFVAVLAYQVPKTLKMLKGPAAAAVETAPVSTPSGTALPATGAAAPAAAAPAASQPAVLIDSDLPVEAGAGQLRSFELFRTQDPFLQQIDSSAAGQGAGSAGAADGDAGSKAGSAPSPPAGSIVPVTGSDSGERTGPSEETAPTKAPVPPATATTIALNGSPAVLAADGSFPEEEPIFVLVSTSEDGRSVEIGIAGGAYADGEDTVTLEVGKPLTLQNTADGSRYKLELLTVAGFAPPKPKK